MNGESEHNYKKTNDDDGEAVEAEEKGQAREKKNLKYREQ